MDNDKSEWPVKSWADTKDFWETQVDHWTRVVPRDREGERHRAQSIGEAAKGLSVTLRCEHGRLRAIFDEMALLVARPSHKVDKARYDALMRERDQLLCEPTDVIDNNDE